MKKIITLITVAIFSALALMSCGNSDTVKVEAGNGEKVNVNIFTLGIGIELSDYMKSGDIQPFIQEQCNILKGMCNNERTFVPESVGFLKILETITVDTGVGEITLYRYQCDVRGVAKNSFGVEGDVQLFVGADVLDEPRFVIKNDFSGEHPFYSISKFGGAAHEEYDIPFKYNGKTYWIYTCGMAKEKFVKAVQSL